MTRTHQAWSGREPGGARLQGPDRLHAYDQQRQFVGADAQDLGVRADRFPRWLSLIRSTDKGASWGKEERIDIEFPASILVGRDGDSTIDVEPVPCPDPSETGSCPIRSGDFIPDVGRTRATGISTPSGWTSGSTAGSPHRPPSPTSTNRRSRLR